MQNGFGKSKLHTIKQDTDQNENPKRLQNNIIQMDQIKGHSLTIQKYIEMVTTPTLCRDCKHIINHYSQCHSNPLMPCSIQLHETPIIAQTT